MRAAGLTAALEGKLLFYNKQAIKIVSGWSSMRKAFKQFAFSMAQVAPPDDDDFVEENDNEIAPSGEPSDNTMWSKRDIMPSSSMAITSLASNCISHRGSEADEQGSTEFGSTSQRTWLKFLRLGTLNPNPQIYYGS